MVLSKKLLEGRVAVPLTVVSARHGFAQGEPEKCCATVVARRTNQQVCPTLFCEGLDCLTIVGPLGGVAAPLPRHLSWTSSCWY